MSDRKPVCPMCGGETFVDGTIVNATYVPGKTNSWREAFRLTGAARAIAGSGIPTRTCTRCGFAAIMIPRENIV
jgi:ribosomal protein S27AE